MNCKEELKKDMQENHHFLWKMYTEKPHTIRRLLKKASNSEVCTLIKIVYCVEQGYIPIKKKKLPQTCCNSANETNSGFKISCEKITA